MRHLYSLLLYVSLPLVLLRLIGRGFRQPDYWRRWSERFGFVAPPPQPVAAWVHAVSVGESVAAQPLIEALLARHGAGSVWVTTTTPTGSARVRATFGERVRHSYLPYDLPDACARFLDRVRPRQLVLMETELWPNLLQALKQRGIAVTLANARLSPRSFRGYSRVRPAVREMLSAVRVVAAQSAQDAERFRALGATRVEVVGNLKFELTPPEAQVAQGRELRQTLGESRPVWVAASTHEDEEAALLQVHRQVLAAKPEALLILVPRHPQRFEAVAALIAKSGLEFQRRSGPRPAPRMPLSVFLGDSMGEMTMYLAAADVAFVGGSLLPVGGHNVLEPAALGLPVLFGPFMHNFVGARDLLIEAGAGFECDAGRLADEVLRLLEDADRRRRMGDAGRRAVESNRGALTRLLGLLPVGLESRASHRRDSGTDPGHA